MGHSYSDFAIYTDYFCGWEYPHKPHENGVMYHENTCPGFEPDVAREYKERRFPGSYSSRRPDYYVCPDCGSMVYNREVHDDFHKKLDLK